MLGLGYSRFMIQESGSCLVSARGWQWQFTPRRIRDDERVRLHRTRRRRRVRTFKRTTTTDVYSHATARRVRRRGRLCDRGDDDRQHPPGDVERRTPGRVVGVHGKFGIMRVRGEQSELTDGWWTEDRRARHSGAI